MQASDSHERLRIWFLFLIVATVILAATAPQVYGERESGIAGRALDKRAAEVTKMKNDFVTKVLLQERIPYKIDEAGIVVLIQIEGIWAPVEKVEIVPVLRDDGQGAGIVAHELYFTTASGVYRLVSDLAVRK